MAGLKYNDTNAWVIAEAADAEAAAAISAGLGVTAAMGRLLYKRGCRTADEARSFIRMNEGCLYDPFLLPDMRPAVEKIKEAVAAGQKIMIYGDYDADGVTSVSVLYLYLSELGADVGYYIPTRSEGYGLSQHAIGEIAESGVRLIITVDTGTTAIEEIKYAYGLGVEVVVTDHHECIDELPSAAAVVNPQRRDSGYPFSGLAGVGVVFKLVCALEAEMRCGGDVAAATLGVSKKYIDLVAIGTIADVMPMRDENRMIIAYGLRRIEETSRPGLCALMEASASGDAARRAKKPRITSGYISFTIAPRINAAGRMGDASLAVELFLSRDAEDAARLARRLCEVNLERQRLENIVAAEAFAKIESSHDFENDPVIVVADDGWHHGIIGIVASRVTEKYGRPSILISFEGDGDEHDAGKGSGRSVRGLNLAFALSRCGECLLRYGGHELAAGLSIERGQLDTFRRKINEIARCELHGEASEPVVTADDVLSADEMTLDFAEELRLLEPYGVGNPTPVFMTENVRASAVVGVGSNKHTRLTLEADGRKLTAMCFAASPEEIGIRPGEYIDLLSNLDINEFRGERSVQLIVRRIRKNEAAGRHGEDELSLYRALRSGTASGRGEYDKYIPERAELAALYRVLRREIGAGKREFTAREISSLTADTLAVGYVKTKLSLDIFSEMDILAVTEVSPDVYTVDIPAYTGKADLEKSKILGMLRRKYLN